MDSSELADRLASLPALAPLPRAELEWLAARGHYEKREPGVFMAPGESPHHLSIVLSGRIVVRIDRGGGTRRAMEWHAGELTGLLPFSRMAEVRNDVFMDVPTEVFQLDRDHFPEMVNACPEVTAHAVHTMIDRARHFNTGALQDEKMVSLGRLAAGLAHELNNPASATMRGAKRLRTGLSETERASRALARAGLSEDAIESVEHLWSEWLGMPPPRPSFDREDEIAEWLSARGLDRDLAMDLAGDLSHTPVSTERLDELAELIPHDALGVVLTWIAHGSDARTTAADIEHAAGRIYELVESVKRFTDMDRAREPKPVDVVCGIEDAISILRPGIESKNAAITLDTTPDLPPVRAVPSELNQVWMKLIENAMYAIGKSGRIDLSVGVEHDRVVVRVIDDGPGIAAEDLPHIFDPFFTTKPPGEGMGLGLEVARQLARRYGGEIEVESKPGRTEFRVRLSPA